MKLWVMVFIFPVFESLFDTYNLNREIEKAEKARKSGQYNQALLAYRNLYYHKQYRIAEVVLNFAHCHYETGNLDSASYFYGGLFDSQNQQIRSIAYQQNGNISAQNNKIDQALEDYKNALRSNPNNEQARFNYEALKKQQQQQKSDQDKKDQKQQNDKDSQQDKNGQKNKENKQNEKQGDQQNQDQNKPDDKDSEKKRFEQINLTPEQAKIIMNTLKSSELKYIQNMKKKPLSKIDKNKPDW